MDHEKLSFLQFITYSHVGGQYPSAMPHGYVALPSDMLQISVTERAQVFRGKWFRLIINPWINMIRLNQSGVKFLLHCLNHEISYSMLRFKQTSTFSWIFIIVFTCHSICDFIYLGRDGTSPCYVIDDNFIFYVIKLPLWVEHGWVNTPQRNLLYVIAYPCKYHLVHGLKSNYIKTMVTNFSDV